MRCACDRRESDIGSYSNNVALAGLAVGRLFCSDALARVLILSGSRALFECGRIFRKCDRGGGARCRSTLDLTISTGNW